MLLAVLEHGRVSPGSRASQVLHTRILPVLWEGGLDAKCFLSCGLWLCPVTQNAREPRVGCGDRGRGLSGRSLAASLLPGLGVGSGSRRGARLGGLFLCRGSAGSPSRGGEHPPRGRNFLRCDIFSETQSEWKGAGGRRQISIGRSCALPRAFVPGGTRSQGTPGPVRGQWGHPWDPPPPWERGQECGGGCLHPGLLPGCRAVTLLTPRDPACGPAGDVAFCILK